MADQWNAGNPALTNTIAADIPDINENTHWLKDIIQMLAGWKTSDILTVGPGCVTERAKFEYSDTNTIKINAGGYFHDGTTRQWVFWDQQLTFDLGSGGSNSASTDLGASQWHYIYLDDSAIVTGGVPELTAARFLNSTTAPTWLQTGHGWYTGADRCIFAVLTNSSSEIIEFWHDGGDYVQFGDRIVEANAITPSNTWTDVDMATSVPGFSTKANISFVFSYIDTDCGLLARVNGQSGTTGIEVGSAASTVTISFNTLQFLLSSAQVIEVKCTSASAGNTAYVLTNGWYLPVGM